MPAILEQFASGRPTTPDDWRVLLDAAAPEERRALQAAAYRVKRGAVGRTVYFRGIIELSNICRKNCYYCGIRAGNTAVERYDMPDDDVLRAARWAHEQGYASVLLQAGEREDDAFTARIERLVRAIKQASDGKLGITLSLGEQEEAVYRAWFAAGAHRYLLRIETANRRLYERLHPADHDFDRRTACLDRLRRTGYQVGTGVMIGLPGQTTADLAGDLRFFRDADVDMIGMGPYVPHRQTPLAADSGDRAPEDRLALALNMIAVTRLVLPDINIAATTALQALHPEGRELGLRAGANIVMPNITDTRYRTAYQLYEGKPCLDENAAACRGCLGRRVAAIGETIGYNQWGDAPHFFRRRRSA